jgi:23S rRNA pseudouridine1911/1915/1917 synthase
VPRATVDTSAAGARLDQFVARLIGGSVHAARRLIVDGRVSLDGRAAREVKKGIRLTTGQDITVELVGTSSPAVLAEPEAPLAVLFCDAHLVAVNKPAGIPSHPLRPGEKGTLANALIARFPECAGAADDRREAGLGHRLDNGTSGVLLAARRHDVWLALRAALRAPTCEKHYLAEVVGSPAEPRGSLAEPIGRHGRRGSRVVVGGQGRNPQSAVTEWDVIERRPASALLRVRLHAGRAHQVRAHLASLGHPLVGDVLYRQGRAGETVPLAAGARGGPDPGGGGILRLHAESVSLLHPMSGEPLLIVAPAPDWAKVS